MKTAIEPLLEQRSELHAEVERLLKERSELRAEVERLLRERSEPLLKERAALRVQVDRLWAALLIARRWIPECPISPIAAEDLRIVNEALRWAPPRTSEQETR